MIKQELREGQLVKVRKFKKCLRSGFTPTEIECHRHNPLLPPEMNNDSELVAVRPEQIGLYAGTVRRLLWQYDIVLIEENVVEINQGLLLAL